MRLSGPNIERSSFLSLAVLAACLVAALEPASAEERESRVRVRRSKKSANAPVTAPAKTEGGKPQPTPPDALIPVTFDGSVEPALVDPVRQRLDKDLAARNQQRTVDHKPLVPMPESAGPRAMIDMAHYGFHHTQSGPHRFLALHLILDNPTAEPLQLARTDISVKLDGEAKPLQDLPDGQHFSFAYGSQFQNLQNHKQLQEIKVPPQGVAGGWLLHTGLPMTSEVPAVQIRLTPGNRALEIDVTESQRALLQLNVESLGPRQCLRLLTIRGMLNSINVRSFVETLEELSDRKVVRCVVRWTPESLPQEQNLIQWLVQSTTQLGSGRPVNEQFPSLPATLREFHLVQTNGQGFPNFDQYGRPTAGTRLHKTVADAVGAALKSAYLALPADELMDEIRHGHPLTRAAALRHGAGRLNASHLPFLLECIGDEDADIQNAAVRALSHFGEPSALDALAELARKKSDPLSGVAIESLASSRYSAAQTKLLELIRQENSEIRQQIMQVLARYPRPQWSETIYAYVSDPKENLPIEGVRALLKVGHPRLVDVLETCLKSSEKPLRDLAFPILAQRNDARSERLATEYALAELQQRAPDGSISQFLHRTKLTRAIPPLLKHLESAPDKGTILNLLAQIGDESVGDAIAGRYEKLQNHEKSAALNALCQLRHPKFRPLAGEALLTSDGSMISQATQGLMQDGGVEACRLLIAALDKQTNNFALSHICNALGNMGGSEARSALLKARESDNPQRKNYAINALMHLRQRSPGYNYIYQAQHHGQQKQWKESLEFYDMALQIDPELPEALAGRASVKQRLGKLEEAAQDFEKAYELDPYNSLAIPGVAVVRVQAGRIDEGLKIVERGRERYQHDPNYIYNSACVYAQAFERMRKETDNPEREARQEEYRKKAISELQLAVQRGFSDYNTMQDDPDLKVLHDDAEFKKLLGNRPAAGTAPAEAEPADADVEDT